MIVLLRLIVIAVTAVLSASGIFGVVVALLAAQWLVVAGAMLVLMGIVSGAVTIVRRLARAAGASGPED